MADLVEVWLEDDYYTGEGWIDPESGIHPDYARYYKVRMIPREQRDRWRKAVQAYGEMQREIAEYLKTNPPAKLINPAMLYG